MPLAVSVAGELVPLVRVDDISLAILPCDFFVAKKNGFKMRFSGCFRIEVWGDGDNLNVLHNGIEIFHLPVCIVYKIVLYYC